MPVYFLNADFDYRNLLDFTALDPDCLHTVIIIMVMVVMLSVIILNVMVIIMEMMVIIMTIVVKMASFR